VLAIGAGRPSHLGEGDHIWSGTGIGSLRVVQTLVGGFANQPQGSPVLGGDPLADAEVPGVADHRLGAQRPVLLEVLLDPAGLVVAVDLRIDVPGDHLGAEGARRAAGDPPVKISDTESGRSTSRWSRMSCSKNARPAAGRSNTRVSETSNWRNASS